MILDLEADGRTILSPDESFKTKQHSAYSEMDVMGYDTQFTERYSSKSAEVEFFKSNFDDSTWETVKISNFDDHILVKQKSKMLVFERISPRNIEKRGNKVIVDFGAVYVGYLEAAVCGIGEITVHCSQELDEEGNVRFDMRCGCRYEEIWELSGKGVDRLDWFDYKSFRYAELILPSSCEVEELYLTARHYPFQLEASLKEEYAKNSELVKIWDLCVRTMNYGVQEVIQDCMDREKGFYMGDGCYTALTHMILTGDDSMVKKLIDDSFSTGFITDGLVTCLDCSKMQEIAEYPLMPVFLVLWHFRITGERNYLARNYSRIVKMLEAYRRDYEKDSLLRDLDKWCVVEWPKNFRHGYDVDIEEGKVCEKAHISINAYYIAAIKTAKMLQKGKRACPFVI